MLRHATVQLKVSAEQNLLLHVIISFSTQEGLRYTFSFPHHAFERLPSKFHHAWFA
jgi:hypothetical protein